MTKTMLTALLMTAAAPAAASPQYKAGAAVDALRAEVEKRCSTQGNRTACMAGSKAVLRGLMRDSKAGAPMKACMLSGKLGPNNMDWRKVETCANDWVARNR